MMSLPDFRYKQIAVYFAGGSRNKLKFKTGNIVIQDDHDQIVFQHSCHRLFALFVIGEISLTSIVIKHAVAFAFPIILMNRNLKVIARINCGAEGNTLLRMKQYSAGNRNLKIARELVQQKIRRQISLLESLRSPSADDKHAIDILRHANVYDIADTPELMGLEGYASKIFFAAYFRPLGWTRREPRCKRDIYNLLLDIGYTYLFNFIEAMLSLYGFDLYCGVLHTFFYQRKSLVCDIIEPFRCIIDRRIRKAYNLKQIARDDFFFHDNQYHLEWKNEGKYTKLFLKDILAEKENIFRFCQTYYRWFMKNKSIADFPVYEPSAPSGDHPEHRNNAGRRLEAL